MPFIAGRSGNPAGRPRGKVGKDTELRKLLQAKSVELIGVLISRALSGDSAALKLAIDRIIPPIKSKDSPVVLSLSGMDTSTVQGMLTFGQTILGEVASGGLTPEEGQKMASLLESQRRLIETTELVERIEVLEARSK